MQPLQLGFQPAIDRTILGWAVCHDENLRAALLEDQLGRPRARVLERGGILCIEQALQPTQTRGWRRRNDAVSVRPQLSQEGTLAPRCTGRQSI